MRPTASLSPACCEATFELAMCAVSDVSLPCDLQAHAVGSCRFTFTVEKSDDLLASLARRRMWTTFGCIVFFRASRQIAVCAWGCAKEALQVRTVGSCGRDQARTELPYSHKAREQLVVRFLSDCWDTGVRYFIRT